MSWLPFVFSRAASFRARWSKRREDGRIIVSIARLFSKSYAETRDRTGDLQIFSLTLSQLSYRGCYLFLSEYKNVNNIDAKQLAV